jgi:hypothetical protein
MSFTAFRRPQTVVAAERFSPAVQDAWHVGARRLAEYGVLEEWPLWVWNYESAGLDHLIVNSHGYSGLFQRAPINGRPYVELPGKRDPVVQVRDSFAFWISMITEVAKVEWFTSLGAFYCLNLAPAKVNSRVVYAGPGPWFDEEGNPADEKLSLECAAEFKARPRAYAAQDEKLDPHIAYGEDGKSRGKGWLAASDFGPVVTDNFTKRMHAEWAAYRARFPAT